MTVKAVYEIDGRDFATLEEFDGVVSAVLIPGAEWGHNLDVFNDILRQDRDSPGSLGPVVADVGKSQRQG